MRRIQIQLRLPLAHAAVVAAMLAPGCTQPTPDGEPADAGPPDSPATAPPPVEEPPLPPAPDPRADSVRDTVMLEGMPEPITLRLYRSPPGAPVPFSVYLPRSFDAEVIATGEAWTVRFAADFAGTGEAPGWIEVLFHPLETSEAQAREALRQVVRTAGREERPLEGSPRYGWSIAETGFTTMMPDGRRVIGTVALGRHGDRLFQLTIRYPEEWGDGFGPRAALLLDTWRWGSGEGL